MTLRAAALGWLSRLRSPRLGAVAPPQFVPIPAPVLFPLFDVKAEPGRIEATPNACALYADTAAALIAVASVQAPTVALESYRLAANYGSADGLAFYGATLFYLGLTRPQEKAVSDDVLGGLACMESAMLQGASMATGLLQEAVSMTPPAALAAWHERSGLVAQ